jgi:hypothetical protein
MAVSLVDANTGYRDSDTAFIKPRIKTLNPRNAANLVRVLEQYEDYPEMTIDLSNVKIITNVAARMLCKALYGRNWIIIENTNEAVFSSLDWAADYLYRKGELDRIPWQISEMVY